MVVVGAAFTADAALDAAQALAQLPGVGPNAIARAPLGAVGRLSEGMVLLAVCVPEHVVDQVARIVEVYGGEIVSRTSYPERVPNDSRPGESQPPRIARSGTVIHGKANS